IDKYSFLKNTIYSTGNDYKFCGWRVCHLSIGN
ncbi:MAG: hypothetical protein ACI90V_014449, partial [Bacillariaceae sp.]